MKAEFICGDAVTELKKLPEKSVQCVVTSPPYWGLRNYSTHPILWSGELPLCENHIWQTALPRRERHTGDVVNLESKQATSAGTQHELPSTNICSVCGAWRGELGLEPTPELYVKHLVQIFREVWRVLRGDGTLWLNLGDSYASNGCYLHSWMERHPEKKHLHTTNAERYKDTPAFRGGEYAIKAKDLVGIPWRVAFALQSDGWWLRSDIIWAKPNPMPESVTDRPTKSHEYIFLLTKSAKYFYDADAIKEPCVYAEPFEERCYRASENHKAMPTAMKAGIRPRKKPPQTFGGAKAREGKILEGDPRFRNGSEQWGRVYETIGNRNKRSVWTVPTSPYREAHFATFPPDLIKPCILAGTKLDDTVLDPFGGSGTTGMVAIELGRKAILIELNPKYVQLEKHRCNVTPGLPL
jgi:DNA modification methylase